MLLARRIKNSPLWISLKPTHRLVLIELILQAQFQDSHVVRNEEIIFLKRGQVATSYQKLVNDINSSEVTVKVVRSAINKLIKYNFLTKDEAIARAKKGLLLTLVNYEFYQNPENYKGKAKGRDKDILEAKKRHYEGPVEAINNKVNNDIKIGNKYNNPISWDDIREEVLNEDEEN
ncbi:hypothetical protein ACRBU7_14380 [Priestia aryabhattai]|uniref:hypothetical protein n=1 Tax=Priestia aryabhattai TaxID=412384 RepID=UPI003D7F24F5